MGVTGLWKLIEPCGQPVPVDTLECKILAVDISIWLHQVVKGFQDNKGSALPNAHLLGLFHRLCKLLYYRVKPVFVFDGCVPQLKRDTIARRQLQRSKLNSEAERIQALLLQSLAKEKVVQQALGANAAELLAKSPNKRVNKTSTGADDAKDDLFKLPEMPNAHDSAEAGEFADPNDSFKDDSTLDYTTTTSDESFDDSNPRHYYNSNLQGIDVRSKHFKALPADVRHDILVDIKETRKQSSWGRLHELPAKSDDFSLFQMKRLLKRRAVQESIEEAEQEMGGRTLTFSELQNLFTEEGIVEQSTITKGSKQISSDENTRFLLVRDLKKKLAADVDSIKVENLEPKQEEPCSSQQIDDLKKAKTENDSFGEEYDKDLELAIALSLEQSTVYNEKDYEYDSDEDLKLNKEQSKQLKNAAKGPARAYMIEYAGINDEELMGIMEKTQNINELDLTIEEVEKGGNSDEPELHYDDLRLHVTDSETNSDMGEVPEKTSNEQLTSIKYPSSTDESPIKLVALSDTDSDLEEVPFVDNNQTKMRTNTQEYACLNKNLEVVLDLTKSLNPQDDLFSDVFEENLKDTGNKNFAADDSRIVKNKILLINTQKPNVNAVLDELKKQAEDIPKIKLDDIKIDSSFVELSDDESQELLKINTKNVILNTPRKKEVRTDIIEIPDEECTENNFDPNSPLLKTPTKGKAISEYFQTDYLIKRTPEGPYQKDEKTPEVKSPFFVNKTPKSNKKRSAETSSDSPTSATKVSKATKSLFPNDQKCVQDESVVEMESFIKKPLTAEDVLNEAANALKEQVSTEELKDLASSIAKEKRDLESERNRQDRMGMSISQRMNSDCQELLRLFGIPYIVAPMEAEAQCAFLDAMKLTNGTITDDSDIWLFGGRTVYKNFFAQNKHVLEFRADNIEKSFNCDRAKLIQLACLVGSDYTTGIHGIGAVTAMEILATFCSKERIQGTESSVGAIITSLCRFRDWWTASKITAAPPGSSSRLALHKKLKNIELHEGFPNIAVIDAYLSPKIDDNKENFAWGFPDVDSIREFARKTFGWTTSKTDDILMPVIKKINEKKTQATIKNYFSVKSAVTMKHLKVSKRIQNAIDTMSGKIEEQTAEKAKSKPKRASRKKNKAEPKANDDEDIIIEVSNNDLLPHTSTISSNTEETTITKGTKKKKIVLPSTKEVIPQREKDLEAMRKNKEKAAKILNKTKKTNKQI